MQTGNYVGYSESKYRLRISIAHPRDSLCACAVTSSINWETIDAISWDSCYVYVYSFALHMFKTIEGAADCEIRSVIRFLDARNVLPSEIHHQICQVYCDNAMSDGMVRKWARMFNEGRENVHDEARSWWMMIWCVRSTKECVTTDVHNFWSVPALSSHFKDSTLWHCQ